MISAILQFTLKCTGKKTVTFQQAFSLPVEPQKDDRIPVKKGLSLTVLCRTMQPGSPTLVVICGSRNARKTDEQGHIDEFVNEGWTIQ